MKDLSKINKRNEVLQCAFNKRILAKDIRESNLANNFYIKQHANEDDEDYKYRLRETYFFNKIDNVINNYVSKPFKRDFRITEKNGEDAFTKEVTDNFDGSGTNATDYLKLTLKESLYYSQAQCFVDIIYDDEGNKTHSVNLLNLDDILDFDFDKKGKLSYLRFRTEEHVREGFNIKKYLVVKEYIKIKNVVYWNDYISINPFLRAKQKEGMSFKERVINEVFGIPEISLVSFYPIPTTKKFNPDLMFKNAFELQLIHFKTASRLKNNEVLYSTATKVLKTVNVDDNENRKMEYNSKSLFVINQDDSLLWDVPPHELLDKMRNEMTSISNEIDEVMGNILYGKTNGSTTATENVLNTSNTNNFLSSISNSLQWFAESIINYIKIMRNEIGVEVETTIITDYSISLNQTEVTTLFQLYALGGISLEDLFEEMKRRNLFDDYLEFENTMKKRLLEDSEMAGVTVVEEEEEITKDNINSNDVVSDVEKQVDKNIESDV